MRLERIQLQPPAWARGGHPQTIFGHLLRLSERPLAGGEEITIDLPDGDQLAAELHSTEPGSGTVVYLYHGLGGDTSAGYMRRTARLCLRMGHSVLLVNHRGCGTSGRKLRHSQPYHSGRSDDLGHAIALGRKRFPKARHLAIGFSLSGNALLLLLANERGPGVPDGGIAVNAPINLSYASRELSRGLSRIYDLRFVAQCRADVIHRQKSGWVPGSLKIPRFATCGEFDSLYTAPFGGFDDRETYYRVCSAAQYLDRIEVPTVLITSEDDPFVSAQDYLDAKLSPSTRLWLASTGGHMGYLAAQPGAIAPEMWLDGAIRRALEQISEARR